MLVAVLGDRTIANPLEFFAPTCSIFPPIQQLFYIMRSVICSQWTERQHGIESRRCHTTTFRTTNAATNEEVPKLDETVDGAIAVELTVFNSILEVGALTAATTTTTNQETSTTAIPCRTIARSNANAWKQAAPHRDVLPLNDSSTKPCCTIITLSNSSVGLRSLPHLSLVPNSAAAAPTTQPRQRTPPIMSWL